jgi:hypothetical protein
MDKLQGEELKRACGVLHDRYKRCVKTNITQAFHSLDPDAAAAGGKKCSAMYDELFQYCKEVFRSGEMVELDKAMRGSK